jgi:hypothetical protein
VSRRGHWSLGQKLGCSIKLQKGPFTSWPVLGHNEWGAGAVRSGQIRSDHRESKSGPLLSGGHSFHAAQINGTTQFETLTNGRFEFDPLSLSLSLPHPDSVGWCVKRVNVCVNV